MLVLSEPTLLLTPCLHITLLHLRLLYLPSTSITQNISKMNGDQKLSSIVRINGREELNDYKSIYPNYKSKKLMKSMKSKKKAAPKIAQSNSPLVQQVQQAPIYQAQMNNVQQQQFYNYQQQQQAPQMMPNMLLTNAQQQMASNQVPIQQMNMQVPMQQNINQVGYYGGRQRQTRGQTGGQYDLPSIFNDDEPFLQSVKEVGKEGKVELALLAQRSQVKLGEQTILPAMCQVISSGGDRTSVDLICVIDVSGSMSGEKIQLVRQTMKVLIETLTPSDRLSIITFQSSASRICPLKAVTQESQVIFTSYINQMHAGGGTSIMSGMNLAFKTIRDRKIPNKATSIFLLSDGQDGGAETRVKEALNQAQNKDLGIFSIHSFGFGTDHDEDLMNKIACLRDGSFYFIKQLGTLDEAFCNALGGIISLVASEIILNVRCIAQGLVQGIKITKVFGDKWQKINEHEYRIKITQLMSEISKQFVFQLTIPAIGGQVGDIVRQHIVLEGVMQAKGINGQQMDGACNLSLTLINPHEQIAEINQNIDVIENYLRVKAAQAIEQNMKKAEANKFEQAQSGIDKMINNIQGNKKARKEKMQVLVKDLQQIREKCSKQDWQHEGRKWMVNAQQAHSSKANYQYSNCVQAQMVAERKSKKSKY